VEVLVLLLAKFIKNLHIENDTKTEWLTKGGTFHTSGRCMNLHIEKMTPKQSGWQKEEPFTATSRKCTMNFILNEFYESKFIEWILHVNKTFGPHWYDMIIGHDLMSQLRIILDFDGQTIMWDNPLSKWKNTKTFWTLIHQ
jgi:hypothetical protein